MHILGAIVEFERGRIVERVRAGLAREKAQGKRIGRQPYAIADAQFEAVADQSLRDAATTLGVSRCVVHRWRLSRKPLERGSKPSRIAQRFRRSRRDRVCHADN